MGSRSSVLYRALAFMAALTCEACGARTPLEDAELFPEPGPREGAGAGEPTPSESCEPCGPFVECTACYVQGQPHTYRCAPDEALGECMHLQESHVDSVGVAYTCFYCATAL